MVTASAPNLSTSLREPSLLAGRYQLLDELGVGGMGTVHRARDQVDGRLVALKQLSYAKAGGRRRAVEALFEREYHTLVRLRHPRIIEVYDYGVAETGPYYTMELLDGKDLMQLGALHVKDACRHLRDIASSLALIHAHRLVHRDVSPRNVRLTLDGRPKLIDFGALTSFGVPEDVVGTPHCMAPEILDKMPLDQRTDLYALGAVAYFTLTGRAAYAARSLSELATAWQTPLVAPSVLAPSIPRELSALVVSLLSLDPLGRPPTAAAVIDQLTAIAGLEPEEHELTAESYLASSRMVGRMTEVDWVARRVKRALDGRGAEVIVEGGAGIGKTRLLHEAGLDAKLRGAVVLKADAQATAEPFGVAMLLSKALLDACPEVARRSAKEHAPILVHLSKVLADKLGDVAPSSLPADPGERRARFQTALHDWFLDVGRKQTLFIAVDNVQAADDNSAAFLSALGREARRNHVVLLVTQRTGEKVLAEAPVRLLRQRASRLKLAGLDPVACEELVKSVFGDVPNTGRVARLLFERSAGIPQHFMELVRILVRRGIAKYTAGTWVLPQDVAADELPAAAELLPDRLASLGPRARALAEILCIQSKPVELERCVALAEGRVEGDVYAALDELVADRILSRDGNTYRFTHGALRDTLLAGLNDADRCSGHVRAAQTLLAVDPDNVAVRVEAALHFLDAGEELRGADVMVKLGLGLLSTTYFNAGSEAVVALSRAFDVLEREGRSEYELLPVLFPMMKLAYYSPHWRLILRHGERALSIGMRVTGLSLAQKLAPFFGRKLALAIGLIIGSIGFARQRKRGLGYDLKTAIKMSCAILPAITSTHATCLDPIACGRVERIVEPLLLFGPEHVAGLMYQWAPMQRLTVQGREGEAWDLVEENIRRNQSPAVREAMGEVSWKSFSGGLMFPRALFATYAFGQGAQRGTADLEQLGIQAWAMAADQIRMLYHAFRGETEEVQRYRDRVEVFAVQGSTTWQAELFWPALLLNADVLTGDALAARRTSEQLARRARDVESMKRYADAARAAYLALRGELPAAIALYEEILPKFPLREAVGYETTRAYFAQALNLAGDHARAKKVVTDVISGMIEQDHRIAVHFLEPQRQLALAEAGLGNHAEAVRILDELLSRYGAEDNPLLVGLLHKARAEVAVRMRDVELVEHHVRETERRFRGTRNSALIGQWERLSESVSRAGLSRGDPVSAPTAAQGFPSSNSTTRTLGELSAAPEPCEYALKLVLDRSKAKSGFLYLYRHDSMHLVAATGAKDALAHLESALARLAAEPSRAPSPAVRSELGHRTSVDSYAPPANWDAHQTTADHGADDETVASTGSDLDAGDTVFVSSSPPPSPGSAYQLVLLGLPVGGTTAVVGGLILEADASEASRLGPDFLGDVARVLHERRAMTSAYSSFAH